jgi:uncharacterized protein YbaP (TraB family)
MFRAKFIGRVAVILTAASLAGAALAQDIVPAASSGAGAKAATEAPDPNDTLVSSLVVKSAGLGPAFWKVTKGDSTVWLMGAPQALPKGLTWNQDEMKRHLRGANLLILGPDRQSGNVFSLIWIFLTQRDKFKAEAPLDKTLPPDMLARFDAVTHRTGDNTTGYRDVRPILAALSVSFRFQRRLNMQPKEPERTVAREALFRVHSARAGEEVLLDYVKLLQTMPREAELVCMDDALRQAEAGPERAMEAARGWARGDLRVAVSAERGWDHCIAQDKETAAINDRNIQAATDMIARALDKPGKAVALVDLRLLLAQNGVIVRLKAKGLEITPPNAPGIEDEP